MAALPGTQNLRLRRPETALVTPLPPKPSRHSGILQDQLRRSQRGPWCPSFSVAFRILLLIRVSAAMYTNIQDCDEVYNFWEPLHFLDRGYGFQTWELSPAYSIRSWAYILLHILPTWAPRILRNLQKRAAFFAVRIFLGTICSLCEARFYRSVLDNVNNRLGRYLLFFMLFSAGMWNASTAFLPSSFAMYTTMLACSFYFMPASKSNPYRTLAATVLFAAGAIIGWPFSIALAIPFVFEELFVFGADRVQSNVRIGWFVDRFTRLLGSGFVAAALLIPVVVIDSLAYGKLTISPWNIIQYNMFGGSERGPDLYGTEPWYFYILNLLLNFNFVVPLALASLPALFVTNIVDHKRLGFARPGPDQSSPYTLLGLRLVPLYLWLGILTAQKHKEERFMFPAYPLLCFNAATTLYLVRGWFEAAFIKFTSSPYRASKSKIFRLITLSTILLCSLVSMSRIAALYQYYHAPLEVTRYFGYVELPRLLNATGFLVEPPPTGRNHSRYQDEVYYDLESVKVFNLNVCLGKEWYRFPGHYHIADGISVNFIKSDFNGLLPRKFADVNSGNPLWKRGGTSMMPTDLNDLNREEISHYVDIDSCDYLIDLDFPSRQETPSPLEPRYAVNGQWDRVACFPFLDAQMSSLLTRTLWVPGPQWQSKNTFGDYCMLRHKEKAEVRESMHWDPMP